MVMMAYGATPILAYLKLPAELFNGQPVRTILVSKSKPGDEHTDMNAMTSQPQMNCDHT